MTGSRAAARPVGAAAAVLVVLAASAPGRAHHSFAGYEPERQIAFTGVVTHFQWTNPHVYIEMDALGEDGEVRHWLIECANPGILNRVGWRWNMVEVGDEISVVVAPLRSGEPGALLKGIKLADGSVHSNGGPAGPATIPFDD